MPLFGQPSIENSKNPSPKATIDASQDSTLEAELQKPYPDLSALGANDQIEFILQIHLLQPAMKSPFDSIEISENSASVRVWRDLPPQPDPDRVECLGYRWLLTGRGERLGKGAREVFEQFPSLENLNLELVEVDFLNQSIDKHGKLKRVEKSRPYLQLTIDRPSALSISRKAAELWKRKLGSDITSCLKVGRRLIKLKELKI